MLAKCIWEWGIMQQSRYTIYLNNVLLYFMSSKIDWNDTIKKESRGSNDEDLGEVQEVTNGYVLVQRGMINKEKFFIPQDQAESYDGSVLRFRISEDEIINKYMSDMPPSSSQSSQTKETSNRVQQQQQGREYQETKVPLTDEKLNVSKETQQSQATITKEPI